MSAKTPSFFMQLLRTFFSSIVVIFGLCIGLVLVVSFLTFAFQGGEPKQQAMNAVQVSNAEGKRPSYNPRNPIVLQIDISGTLGTRQMNAETLEKQLVESREGFFADDRVKALLITMNSPGGFLVSGDKMYRAIKEYKERYQVPVYLYVDGLCASGGYQIACACDQIYASTISQIGSIGVIVPSFNASQALDKVGVESHSFTAGKDKDLLNPLRPWHAEEKELMQSIVDQYYEYFINLVAHARPQLSKELLKEEYGAHVFMAHDALEKGFIDRAGVSRDETLRDLVLAAGIAEEEYHVYRVETRNVLSNLLRGETSWLQGELIHTFDLPQSGLYGSFAR